MKTRGTFLAATLAMLMLSGCATVTRGTTEAWTVETDPVGAKVTLSSGETCTTPCTLKKKRKDSFQVRIELDGYEPVETQVLSQISAGGAAGMAGNVIVGGLIGVGVDAASGATKELKPNPLVVKLVPKGNVVDKAGANSATTTAPDESRPQKTPVP